MEQRPSSTFTALLVSDDKQPPVAAPLRRASPRPSSNNNTALPPGTPAAEALPSGLPLTTATSAPARGGNHVAPRAPATPPVSRAALHHRLRRGRWHLAIHAEPVGRRHLHVAWPAGSFPDSTVAPGSPGPAAGLLGAIDAATCRLLQPRRARSAPGSSRPSPGPPVPGQGWDQ
jgi:hypothetical protein